jgi:hypothetical protein
MNTYFFSFCGRIFVFNDTFLMLDQNTNGNSFVFFGAEILSLQINVKMLESPALKIYNK